MRERDCDHACGLRCSQSQRFWDSDGRLRGRFGDDLFNVQSLAVSPDSRRIVIASSNSAPVAKVSDGSSLPVWDAKAFRQTSSMWLWV